MVDDDRVPDLGSTSTIGDQRTVKVDASDAPTPFAAQAV